ncbi:hypothetical protein LJR009_002505 [Bosea sp. LjRoot9]|uniref:hypothetical protein n=1 Tax=Bosea sp. LjRoot9 TaxID=3342341 RepID=UPI003ECDB476
MTLLHLNSDSLSRLFLTVASLNLDVVAPCVLLLGALAYAACRLPPAACRLPPAAWRERSRFSDKSDAGIKSWICTSRPKGRASI